MFADQRILPIILISFWIQGCAASQLSPGYDSRKTAPPPPNMTVVSSGYLESTLGYKGDVLGAEIIGVSTIADEELLMIEVSIPVDPNQVDEVQIISSSGKLIKQEKEAQFMRDIENNNVGLKLFLPKQKKWGFTLRLIDSAEDD